VTWIQPNSSRKIFDTQGSDIDTVMAVYTGSPTGLVPVVSDDDSGGYLTSQVVLSCQPNTTYYIAIDGVRGATGRIAFNWQTNSAYSKSVQRISMDHPQASVMN
jgi:hypothetical protein